MFLDWAFGFLIIAIIAMVLGLPSVGLLSAEIARILFIIFIVLFILSMVSRLFRGPRPPL